MQKETVNSNGNQNKKTETIPIQKQFQIKHLPLENLRGEVLVDKLHVVGLQLLHTGNAIALAVKVIRVEGLDSAEHILVMVIHELVVRTGVVPGVERVVADHSERLSRQDRLLLGNVVEVLIVTPREHDIVQSAARRVDTELGAVDGVVIVRVVLEGLGAVDDAVIETKTDGESVTNDIPLALCVEEVEQLAQVVDEAGQLHPAGLAVAADSFCGLEEVLDLGEAGVWVGLVDEGVEFLHGFPDGHLGAGLGVEHVAGFEVVGHCLLGVLLLVEVLDAVTGVFVLAELGLVLVLVELGLFVETLLLFLLFLLSGLLLLQGVLEDVDIVDGVGQVLEGVAVPLGEDGSDGGCVNCCWCHCSFCGCGNKKGF